MLRGSHNFGRVGPVSTLTLEGFWVPGFWDARVAPISPAGTAYAAPMPETPLGMQVLTPDKKGSNSRWGLRVMGMLANNYTLSIGHYRTFLDMPALRLAVGESPLDAWTEMSFPAVEITGGSLSFWETHTDIVFRMEMAWFWDEPVLIPDINTPMIPLPPFLADLASQLMGMDVPGLPTEGRIPKKDILRYMIGLDKNIWIRPLNPQRSFLVSLQYFGSWVQDFDERMRQPLALYPNATEFSAAKETESTFTFLINTDYVKGDVVPQIALAYDVRGAWLFQPSVNYIFGPLRFMIQYSAIMGNMTNFGAFRDRDQVTFIFSYLLD